MPKSKPFYKLARAVEQAHHQFNRDTDHPMALETEFGNKMADEIVGLLAVTVSLAKWAQEHEDCV